MRPVIWPVKIAALAIVLSLLTFQNCSNKLMTPNTPVIDYSSVQSIEPDCQFNRSGLMNGETVVAYRSSTVPTQSICHSEIRTCRNGLLSGTFEYAMCLPGAPAACLIDGRTIPNGGAIKVFQTSSVDYGAQCDAVSETRICNNGVLSGSFTFASCIVNKPVNCTVDGVTTENGKSRRYYRTASVPYLSQCQWEMRVCDNGKLNGTYTFQNCQSAGAQGCILNGVTLANGENRLFYDRTGVPFGQVCPAGKFRTCNNGKMEGETAFQYGACVTAGASTCTFNNQPVGHDQTVDAWSVSTVPFGEKCDTKKETRKCTNGNLSGSFMQPNCVEGQPLNTCKTKDNVTTIHAQVSTVYKTPFATAPATCTANGNSESVYCDNGTFKLGSSAGAVVSGDRYSNCNSDTHLTPFFGSQNDQYHPDVSCAGQRITGLFYGSDGRNPDIDSIGVFCGPSQTQGMIVGTSRGNPGNARCPEGKSVVGVYGQTMGFFNYAITICANDDGTGRAQTGEYGYNHSGQFETWYQMCRPGFVVNKLMVRTGGTVNGFNMECAQVAVGANINCEGTWITQGCNDHYPYNTERFRILQPKGGNGAECPVSDGTARQGEIYCGYVDPGGGP